MYDESRRTNGCSSGYNRCELRSIDEDRRVGPINPRCVYEGSRPYKIDFHIATGRAGDINFLDVSSIRAGTNETSRVKEIHSNDAIECKD